MKTFCSLKSFFFIPISLKFFLKDPNDYTKVNIVSDNGLASNSWQANIQIKVSVHHLTSTS